MDRIFVAVAALSLLGARFAVAQVRLPGLRGSPPSFSLSTRTLQLDTGRLRLLPLAPSSAQVEPPGLGFHSPQFLLSLRAVQLDSGRLRVLRLASSAGAIWCRMPVSVPDSSRLERMPVARIDAAGMAIRVVPPGCFNPLGPRAHDTEPPVKPQHP